MEKMKFTDNQTAFEYALYMIAASYFDKAVCKSKLIEQNMLIQYKEQKLNNQYQMEDTCIAYMDMLKKKLSESFFKQRMEVWLRRSEATKTTKIVFVNSNCTISFYGTYAGKKSKIEYKIQSTEEYV